jgi:hypothetical protein
MPVQIENKTSQSLRVTYRASMSGARQDNLMANQPTIEFPANKTITLTNALWRAAQGPLVEHYLKIKSLVVVGKKNKKMSAESKAKESSASKIADKSES